MLAALAWNALGHWQTTDTLFIVIGLVAVALNRHHINILVLLLIIISMRVAELLLWLIIDIENVPFHSANLIYPVHIIIDIVIIYAIKNKWHLITLLYPGIKHEEIIFTYADYFIIRIYQLRLIVTILAMLEHIARNIDDFGFPESWANPELLLVHSNLSLFKMIMNNLEYILILLMAHRSLRSAKISNV